MSKPVRWTLFTVLGIVAWLGATVGAAVTNDDPSDPAPILRTFAVGGAGFIGLALAAGWWEVRRSRTVASERLYRRLAVAPVPGPAFRAAARGTRGIQYGYLLFAGLTTAVLLVAIGLGEAGPYRELFLALLALVPLWLGFSLLARRRAFGSAATLLAPLGLVLTETPVPTGSGGLAGELRFAGQRRGRTVSVRHSGQLAVTELRGGFHPRSVTSPGTLASMTGEPVRCWQDVAAQTGPEAVVVRRTGNGAGRWFLYDLLLAERLAELTAREPVPPAP